MTRRCQNLLRDTYICGYIDADISVWTTGVRNATSQPEQAGIADHGDVLEAWVGLEELRGGYGWASDAAGDGDLAVVGIGNGGCER